MRDGIKSKDVVVQVHNYHPMSNILWGPFFRAQQKLQEQFRSKAGGIRRRGMNTVSTLTHQIRFEISADPNASGTPNREDRCSAGPGRKKQRHARRADSEGHATRVLQCHAGHAESRGVPLGRVEEDGPGFKSDPFS